MSTPVNASHRLKVKAVTTDSERDAKQRISALDGVVSIGPVGDAKYCWVYFASEDAALQARASINTPSFFSSQLQAGEPERVQRTNSRQSKLFIDCSHAFSAAVSRSRSTSRPVGELPYERACRS
jgi:hypothetical protein